VGVLRGDVIKAAEDEMEGPSLVILREELQPFVGKKVLRVTGNTKQPKESLKGRKLERIETWGKVLFLFFSAPKKATILTKTHFLMFGSYRINDPKPGRDPRLELKFNNGILYFYSCSIQFDANDYYQALDREVDLLSDKWNVRHVLQLMGRKEDSYLCDLFLDQSVFAGSGNIVKNEVLFNIRRHPLTKLSQVPRKDWPKLAQAVRAYCRNFYEWKKKFELRRHWQVYRQSKCPLCKEKLVRENLGKFSRRTFYCARHQPLKARLTKLAVFPVLPVKGIASPEARLDH
jgi:endonuclease-8